MRLRRRSLSSFFKNKVGDFNLDLLFIVVVIFIAGLSWIIIGDSFTSINDDLQSDVGLSAEAKSTVGYVHDTYKSNFDGLIAFLFFGMSLFVIISSWFLDSHPVFFVVTLILLVIIIFAVVVLANTFEDIVVTGDSFGDVGSDWPLTVFIMEHIVGLLLGVGFLSAIAMYGKFRGGGL